MHCKIIYHVGNDLSVKTKVSGGFLALESGEIRISGSSALTIPYSEVTSVEMFRLHGLGRMIRMVCPMRFRNHSRAMNKKQFADAYWTARFAPYVLAAAIIGFAATLFWFRPIFAFLLAAFLSGLIVFCFHVLRWRSGREVFQILALVFVFTALLLMVRYHHSSAADLQSLAAFAVSYSAAVILSRGRVLRGLGHNP